jgi:hypothetical protein
VLRISVDIEADGPIPGKYSMISLGAVVIESALNRTFYGTLRPISDEYIEAALKSTGFTREETLRFPVPRETMWDFYEWITEINKDQSRLPMFVSDNAGFDWMFTCWYFHTYTRGNPFGFSSLSLTSLYKGWDRNLFSSFKHLRDTKHTHNALDDAKGNAEAFLKLQAMGLKVGS